MKKLYAPFKIVTRKNIQLISVLLVVSTLLVAAILTSVLHVVSASSNTTSFRLGIKILCEKIDSRYLTVYIGENVVTEKEGTTFYKSFDPTKSSFPGGAVEYKGKVFTTKQVFSPSLTLQEIVVTNC